jgi:starch synthase
MKIAMVASEINPLVKSGGLADVVYSLSKELVIEGEEVIDILPFYNKIWSFPKLKVKRLGSFDVYMSWRKQSAEVYRTYIDGITYYLIGNDYYFNRDAIYGFNDDGERFAFFALAAKK